MSSIIENLAKILSSRYGKDVRQAIHDSISDINDIAEDSKSIAQTSQSSAAASATAAQNSATAANSAKTAAQASATAADASKVEAASSAEDARRYADSIGNALRPMGTITFSQLPSLASAEGGDMYNISDEFTTTADFKEGAGKVIAAGSNVYKTADATPKWDVLSGIFVVGIKGDAESSYRKGNVNITKDNIGLGNVPNTDFTTDVNELKSNMDDVFNIYGATKNVFPYDPTVNTYPYSGYGVTIDRDDKTGIFTISGTSTEGRVLYLTSRSGNWIANNYVGMKLNIAGTKLDGFYLQIRYYDSSTASSFSKYVDVNYTDDYIIEDYPYIVIGLDFNRNITFNNDTLSFMLRSDAMGNIAKTNRELTEAIAKLDDNKENVDVLDNVDLNSVKTNGIYFVRSNCTNKPTNNSGTLIVSDGGKPSANANQVYIDNVGAIYARYSSDNGSTWGDWRISTHYDSVTITADGVKNYKTLLNELFALIDKGKITHGSVLKYGGNYFHLTFWSSTYIICSLNTIGTDTGEMLSRVMCLNETDSQYREIVIDATGQVTYVNKDTLIPNSGNVFRFYYNS